MTTPTPGPNDPRTWEHPQPYSAAPYYPPPQPQVVYVQQQPRSDNNAGLRQAGTVAIWVWVAIIAIPAVLILGCVLLAIGGSIGSVLGQQGN